MYGARRRRVLLGAVLAPFLAQATFVAAGHPLNDKNSMLNDKGRAYLSPVRWPQRGQRALVLGNGRPAATFIAEMNVEARALGMDHTIYTDPSGFDPSTVSTAADQLRVFQRAMRFPVFRQIVSMASVTLPVAGTLSNYNPLIAEGFAGKTGSDSAAGGCLAFFTHVAVGRHGLTAVGVVLGQGQGGDTAVLLAPAGEAAKQLVEGVAPTIPVSTAAAPAVAGGSGGDAGRRGLRLLLALPRRAAQH